MKKKIAIIGSGITGLVLANFLQKNSDFEFTIYEKEKILNLNEGFGIQLSVNSVSILNQIGFDNSFSPSSTACKATAQGSAIGASFISKVFGNS